MKRAPGGGFPIKAFKGYLGIHRDTHKDGQGFCKGIYIYVYNVHTYNGLLRTLTLSPRPSTLNHVITRLGFSIRG